MLLLKVLLILVTTLITTVYASGGSAGSAIFINKRVSRCWNIYDIVKLRARRLFENVVPQHLDLDKINDKFIRDLIRYFRASLHTVGVGNDAQAVLLQDALADTLGAHLRNEILPAARLAYYAGHISHKNARHIHELFEDIKHVLNTQGLGWKQPSRTQEWKNITVTKINMATGLIFDPCSSLVLKRDLDSCLHFPVPMLDDRVNSSAIALPFKSGGLVSLTGPSSKNALLKYYTTAARCVLHDSPVQCRSADIVSFHRNLWNWLKRDVAPHIQDEKLYTAFGGVLRVVAAVQVHQNSKQRRNLFDDLENKQTIWHPWEALTKPYLSIDTEWCPKMYILLVIAIAVTFFILQIIIHSLCNSNSCNCNGASVASLVYDRMAANTQTVMTTTVSKTGHDQQGKAKPASLTSIRTQKVYDLNENTETLMAIMSGNELCAESTSRTSGSECSEVVVGKSASPPKLETAISEVKTESQRKSSANRVIMGDTLDGQRKSGMTSATRKNMREALDDSQLSYTSTASGSGSSRSESSTTSKFSKSRRSRLLSWDRRVSDSVISIRMSTNTDI